MKLSKTTINGNVPIALTQDEIERLFTKSAQREIKKGGTIYITPEGHIVYYNDMFQCAAEPLAVLAEKRRDLGREIKKLIYSGKQLPLQEIRKMSGLTRGELATLARMPSGTLETYERGISSIRKANYKRITALANALGVTPDELFMVVKE